MGAEILDSVYGVFVLAVAFGIILLGIHFLSGRIYSVSRLLRRQHRFRNPRNTQHFARRLIPGAVLIFPHPAALTVGILVRFKLKHRNAIGFGITKSSSYSRIFEVISISATLRFSCRHWNFTRIKPTSKSFNTGPSVTQDFLNIVLRQTQTKVIAGR
jgi:hypothetical protein